MNFKKQNIIKWLSINCKIIISISFDRNLLWSKYIEHEHVNLYYNYLFFNCNFCIYYIFSL